MQGPEFSRRELYDELETVDLPSLGLAVDIPFLLASPPDTRMRADTVDCQLLSISVSGRPNSAFRPPAAFPVEN